LHCKVAATDNQLGLGEGDGLQMMDLDKALADIRAVRNQIARGTEFRGYGPTAFAATGAIAAAAAWLQPLLIVRPDDDATAYVIFWAVVAGACIAIIAIDVVTRSRRMHSGFADEMIQAAIEQLLPSLVVGALLTFVILRFAPQATWMLPGLWQIILSLGIFASCKILPAPMMGVGVWYLVTGLACLALAGGGQAFSPLAMGLPFGAGQLLSAVLINYLRTDDVSE
jgi:hypothetical protein